MDWVYQIANPADIGIEGRKPNASNGVFGYYGYSLGFQHWILDGKYAKCVLNHCFNTSNI